MEIVSSKRRQGDGNCQQQSRIASLNRAGSVDALARYRDILHAFAAGVLAWADVVARIGSVNRCRPTIDRIGARS